jgi:hypothetical protein
MEQQKIDRATQDLIEAAREVFEAEAARDTAASPALSRILALLPELRLAPEPPEPSRQTVCRHLDRALALGEAGPAAAMATAIRELAPMLAWVQNPRYTVKNKGAEFMDNYAWCGLGLVDDPVLCFGIMLLGPGITYPLTAYAPEGVFYVIGGSPEWKLGDGPWTRVEAGRLIHRVAGGAEGKRPGTEPMLALFAWLYE